MKTLKTLKRELLADVGAGDTAATGLHCRNLLTRLLT